MKIILTTSFLISSTLLLCSKISFCQKNKQPVDSVLEAHSEKWKVKLHRGISGLAKPEFGPYTAMDFKKLDSPVLRKRTKEGSYSEASYSSQGWDWDFSKYETVEKRKAYSMIVTAGLDTAELLFSIYRISNEKNLTFFGELISKDDEDKNQTLAYKTNISGIGATSYDTLPWRFFVEESFSRKEEVPSRTARFTGGYIITAADSLFTEPILNHVGSHDSKLFFEWQTGVFVNSATDKHIAALVFGAPGDILYAWIRNDVAQSQQHAIATVFALIITAKTK